MLSQIIQFIGLVNLPIKPDMCFFLVYDPLIFLIVFFLFHSYLILDWLRNRIHDLLFFYFL
jgi:hypothetical protein